MKEARDQFENQWQSTFEGAEANPPGHIWNSIDSALASQREAGYKKKIIFFKWVAAASVFIAVTSATLVWFVNNGDSNQLAISEPQTNTLTKSDNDSKNTSSASTALNSNESNTEQESANILNEKQSEAIYSKTEDVNAGLESPNMGSENSNTSILAMASEKGMRTENLDNENKSYVNENSEAAYVLIDNEDESRQFTELMISENANSSNEKAVYMVLIENIDNKVLADQGTIMEPWETDFLYLVPNLLAVKSKQPFKEFKMWAGLSVSSGSFNPGTNDSNDFGLSADALESEGLGVAAYSTNQSSIPTEVGSSFSAGLNFGTMVSERIVVSTGIHYLNLSSTTSSNLIVTDPNSNQARALFSSDVSDAVLQSGVRNGNLIVSEEEVDFINRFNYLSIPLKAGYILLDTKFNVTLNTGISSNFLVGNGIESNNSRIQLFNENTNSEIYKPVYFNLLTSIELGYRFKEKYYFSLEPNYRKAISNFTNDESRFTGKPTNLGVSVGLKYIF